MSPQEFLDELGRRYVEGDKGALFLALCKCICRDEPLHPPPWVRRALGEAWCATTCRDIRSWDEIFGALWPKGINIARFQWKRDVAPFVWKRARELIASGRAIDDNLFDEVAELSTGELGTVGPRQAKELYYELEREWSDQLKTMVLQDGTI
jgi:hypothetical protein